MRLATCGLAIAALTLIPPGTAARADTPGDASGTDRDGNPRTPGDPPASPFTPPLQPKGTVQVFTDRAAFLAAAGSVVHETFEDDASTALCDGPGAPVLAFDDFTVTSAPAALKLQREPCFGNHNTTPGGQKYLGADTEIADVSADVMLVFGGFLTALGLDVVDLDVATLEIVAAGGTWSVPPNGDGGESFFGLVSSAPFNVAMLHVASGADSHYSVDELAFAYGGPVALPPRSFGRVKSEYR